MASFSSSEPPAPAPAASHPAPRNNNNNNHKLLPTALIYLAALTVDSDPTLPAAARAALHSSHHAHTQRFVATLVAATGASFHALQLALHYLLRVRNATSAAAEGAAVDPSLSTIQPSTKPQLKHLAAAIAPLSPPASPAPTTSSLTAATTTTQTAPPPHRRRHHHPTTSFTAALLLALKYLRDRGTPPARVLARLAGVPLRDLLDAQRHALETLGYRLAVEFDGGRFKQACERVVWVAVGVCEGRAGKGSAGKRGREEVVEAEEEMVGRSVKRVAVE